MAAITLAPTPPKDGGGMGFWVDLRENLKVVVGKLSDTTSNGTTANTIAELQTFVDVVIAAYKG
jgi:hypothetical protein